MRLFILGLLTSMLFVVSGSALSASVKSMSKYADGFTEEGRKYEVLAVLCSDGSHVPITFWKDRNQWCLGEMASEQCVKKKVRAAGKACKTR